MTTERLATASCALGILAYVGLSSLLSPPQAAFGAAAGSDQTLAPAGDGHECIGLTDTARAFCEAHPDFGIVVHDGDHRHDAAGLAPRLDATEIADPTASLD